MKKSHLLLSVFLLFSLLSCLGNIRLIVPGKWELSGLDCDDKGENCKQLSSKRIILRVNHKYVFIEGRPYKYEIQGEKIKLYYGSLINEGKLIFKDRDSAVLKSTFLKETVYFQLKRVRVEPLNEIEKKMIGKWQITAKNCNDQGECTKKHTGPYLYFLKSGRVMDQKTTETIRFYIHNNTLTLENHKKKKKVWKMKFIDQKRILLTSPYNRKKTYLLEKVD